MPLFSYNCPSCNNGTVDRILSFEAAQDTQFCRVCGTQLDHILERPAAFPVGKYGKGNR